MSNIDRINRDFHGAVPHVADLIMEENKPHLIPIFEDIINNMKPDDCIFRNKAFWYKLPILFKDAKYFDGLDVIDVGSMCCLTSFFIYHIGKARSVTAIEQVPDWSNSCNRYVSTKCDNNVRSTNTSIQRFFESKTATRKTGIYASDILYQLPDSCLENMKKSFLKNPPGLILTHSRENRPCRKKNSYELARHQNLKRYIEALGFDAEYPNHPTGPIQADLGPHRELEPDKDRYKDGGRKSPEYIKHAFNTWVTVMGRDN